MAERVVRCGCGGEARAYTDKSGRWWVECSKCATASAETGSAVGTIALWNKAMGQRLREASLACLADYVDATYEDEKRRAAALREALEEVGG
jgi:hypothetical protein